MLVPLVVLTFAEWLSRARVTIFFVDLAFEGSTSRLFQVKEADDAVVKATDKDQATVDFNDSRVATGRVRLKTLRGKERFTFLPLLLAHKLLR